ncbi:HPr family phosphocarrier protein [Parahaliea sp. F7430]|uniref:HPr family phosphocarrier protein n=1 Tax=Sediminihaliea albiluteola TaxID=2758564 RepID=A0A7W2YJV1_9GAMM|nr:HPr family phosphocarrier protein [Sediminihaliea albiluteola]MBA6412999.1 HPr family phosphocarrier protein [Sediminihaliea albiluteola]
MIKTQVIIVNKLGLHARAAAKFVSCASAYSSDVQLGKDDKMVDGKSIMSVMMLAAGKGSVLDLHIDGDDEEAANDALCALVSNRFEEAE